MLSVGDSLAGYEIVSPVNSGGMGALYVARRRSVGGFAKDVAIKVIHPHLASDEDFVRMFLDEARLTAGIDHPNVIHVHDAGFEDGYYYMVMELVTGCSLADALRACADAGVRLAPRVGVAIARQIAAGLHAAHELKAPDGKPLGLVHRDVTPDNVMLGTHGTVKLIDFGIAKAAERFHVTRGPTLKGKLRYVAPEQLTGKSDRRTDLFALGAVLWESLTGLGLHEGVPEAELLQRARAPVFPPPSETARDVTPELDAAVASLLAVDPANRPDTAAAAQALLVRAVPSAQTVDAADIARLVAATQRGAIMEMTSLIVSVPRLGGAAVFTAPTTTTAPIEPRDLEPVELVELVEPGGPRLRRWLVPVAIVAVATIATLSFLLIDDHHAPTTTATPLAESPSTPATPPAPVLQPTPTTIVLSPVDVGPPPNTPPPTSAPMIAAPTPPTAPFAPTSAPSGDSTSAPTHHAPPRAHPTSASAPARPGHAPRTPTLVDGVPLSEEL